MSELLQNSATWGVLLTMAAFALGTVINERPDFYQKCIDALREEFSAMSGALLAGLLLGGNFLFWLDDRLLGRFAPRAAALCARWEKKHR